MWMVGDHFAFCASGGKLDLPAVAAVSLSSAKLRFRVRFVF